MASAQAQRFRDLEILIGDDGDKAELRDWAQRAAAADPRVRYLKTPGRLGLAGNWNCLAEHARGEFVTIIGDDDRLLPDFAGHLLLREAADAAVIFANHYVIDAAGERLEEASAAITREYGRDRLAGGRLADPAVAVWRNSIPMSASAIRASAIRRLRFKPDINTPEIEFFARFALESPAFVFVPEYLSEYRSHAGSATAAGLTLDRLAEYLEAIDVAAEIEPIKQALLGPMVTSGVGIRLARGDVAGARRLAMSRYRSGGLRPLAQRASLSLPDPLAARIYAMAEGLVDLVTGKTREAGGQR